MESFEKITEELEFKAVQKIYKVIEEFEKPIDKEDLKAIERLFNELDINEEENYINLCNYAYSNKKYKALKFILKAYQYLYIHDSKDEIMDIFFAHLITVEEIDIELLKYINPFTFLHNAINLLTIEESDVLVSSFKRLLKLYDKIDGESFDQLFTEITERSELGFFNYEELVDFLSSYKKEYKPKYAKEEKEASKPFYIGDKQLDNLYSKYGPSNKPIEHVLSENKDCMKGEGCHMFLCNHITTDSEMEEPVDWFLGYCMTCRITIPKRNYSLRFPLAFGGWYGCFCSSACVGRYRPDKTLSSEVTEKAMKKIVEDLFKYEINP